MRPWLFRLERAEEPQIQREHGGVTEVVPWQMIENEFDQYVAIGAELLERGDLTQAEVDDWASGVEVYIRERRSKGEEAMFRAHGKGQGAKSELEAKIARIQNHILPEIRHGDWTAADSRP